MRTKHVFQQKLSTGLAPVWELVPVAYTVTLRKTTDDRMSTVRNMVLGAIGATVVFALLIALVGVGEFMQTVMTISPRGFGVLVLVALLGIASMGTSFFTINHSLELGFSHLEAVGMFTTINLAHNLTPFGQAGGEPIGAVFVSRHTSRPYETCLAAISAFDVINFVPALLIFVFGGMYVAVFNPTIPADLRPIFGAFSIFVLVVTVAINVIHRWSSSLQHVLERVISRFLRWKDKLAWVPSLGPIDVIERVRGYSEALGVVANRPRVILIASCFATLAFVSQGILLWVALLLVDIQLPLALTIVIVPISLLASVIPLPGGGGGIEALQVTLIIALGGGSIGLVLTAVVLSRGIVFWLPVLLGLLTLGMLRHREKNTGYDDE